MSKFFGFVLILALAVSFSIAQSNKGKKSSGGDAEQQISQLMEEGRQAALKGDSSWSEKYMADDFSSVNSIGERLPKSETISRMKAGTVKYEAIDPAEHHVAVHGDSAVYQGKSHLKATRDGQDISGDYWGTWVWSKQGGNWKLVSSQSTRVRQ
jgi:ketosteroid isomerase-like protein